MDGREVKREYQDKLGEEFGAIYYALWNEWEKCKERLLEFGELFGDAKKVALLDAISNGEFIGWVQCILWDDLLMSICRMTDPPKTGGDNLTVRRLPALCKDFPQLRSEVERLSEEATEAAEFARQWRNKRIAHTDLKRATTPSATTLTKASRQNAVEALDAVHATLNAINGRLMNTDAVNDINYPEGARAFISFASQLSEVIQFMDSLIDPSGKECAANTEVAGAFLRKLGCEPKRERVEMVIRLRQAARRFRGGEPI